jgi:alkylhydroperoxidase/carboxymuconolactone decarboxylase family protein YurZ
MEIGSVPFFSSLRAMKRLSTSLSPRIRTLVAFSAFLCLQERKNAYSLMSRQMKRTTLPAEFFSEVLIHLSLFLRYPAVLEALEVLSHSSRRRLRTVSLGAGGRNKSVKGRVLFRAVYGAQTPRVLHNLERLHPGLAKHIMVEAYGRIMSRGGMTLSEREIINVVVLFLQGYEKQLYSHLRGALRSGLPLPVLVDALQYAGTLGNLSARRVVQILKHIDGREAASSF